MKTYIDKIGRLGIFGDCLPNHVLVNEYEAGQGIMVSKFNICQYINVNCYTSYIFLQSSIFEVVKILFI